MERTRLIRVLILQARGWDKGVKTLQRFSHGAGGWRCFQTMPIPVNMHNRVPEEATDFSRRPSGEAREGVRAEDHTPLCKS